MKTARSVRLGAIPIATTYEDIPQVLRQVSSSDERTNEKLRENRTKFSVDGNASVRIADLAESLPLISGTSASSELTK